MHCVTCPTIPPTNAIPYRSSSPFPEWTALYRPFREGEFSARHRSEGRERGVRRRKNQKLFH
jgi:hypothetical protein